MTSTRQCGPAGRAGGCIVLTLLATVLAIAAASLTAAAEQSTPAAIRQAPLATPVAGTPLPEEEAPVGRDSIGVQQGGSIDRPRPDGTTQHVELGCLLIIDVTRKVSASRCAALAPTLPVMVVAYRQEDFESALANKGQVETVYVPKLVPLLTWGLDHVEALGVP